jgi:hypothetical protein
MSKKDGDISEIQEIPACIPRINPFVHKKSEWDDPVDKLKVSLQKLAQTLFHTFLGVIHYLEIASGSVSQKEFELIMNNELHIIIVQM